MRKRNTINKTTGRRIASLLLCLVMASTMLPAATVATGNGSGVGADDDSLYKHISYGGAPYNIDAITGATLTIEGPGVTATVPITVEQIERTPDGNIHRGNYTDQRGAHRYEGVRLLSLLDGAVHSNVERLDDEVNVVFRNRWRHEIGRITYGEIKSADSGAAPLILAYGIADVGEIWISPFVYDGGAGHNPSRGNGDGPLRLVYDQSMILTGPASSLPKSGVFSSVAYLYIEEGTPPPGYKHIAAADPDYNVPVNTEHIITLTGSALGREINYTVRELQNMIAYGADDAPVPGGIGHRDSYSLSNTTYWYVSEYEGVNLWELLVKAGVDRGRQTEENTLVSFSSWDNYTISAQFSFAQLADPDRFMFYEKSPLDLDTNRPTKAQLSDDPANIDPETGRNPYQPDNLQQGDDWDADSNGYPVKKGYPVLLAYGVNSYPYVRDPALDGYRSGLGNHGGPMRVIYGKTDGLNRSNPDALENYAYFFNNGSEQLQKVQEIYVGDTKRYSTHKDNPLPVYQEMASAPAALTVEVITEAGGAPQTHSFTLAQLEEIVYGVDKRTRDGDGRQEKGYYFMRTGNNNSLIQELFEGVNLEYLLFQHIGLPGRLGTVELYNDIDAVNPRATYDLADIGARGSNFASGLRGNLGMVVAYAKNGYPLVKVGDASSPPESGYVHNDPSDPGKGIRNNNGPLVFMRGQTDEEFANQTRMDGFMVERLDRIVVNLVPDEYAHVGPDFADYAAQTIQFKGAVAREGAISVGTLETMQRYIVTDTYSVGGITKTYRGLDILGLLNNTLIGASSLMSEITVRNADGGSVTVTREQMAAATAAGKPVILAYGSSTPPDNTDSAPLAAADGGPMRLVINGAAGLAAVTEIEVFAAALDRWSHNIPPYSQYADIRLEISGQNLKHNRTYTVTALEAMEALIVVDTYRVGSHPAVWFQGVDLYKLLATDIGFADGLTTSSFTITADDGFSTSFAGGDLQNGINGKPMLLGFGRGLNATDGLPLVPRDTSAGYNDVYGNSGGPLRLVIHDNSGLSVQRVVKIVVGAEGGAPDPDDLKDFNVYGLKDGTHGFTIAQLRATGEKTAEYPYRTGGANVTSVVKGVYLYDLLKSLGVGDMAVLTVNTLDNYAGPQYTGIPMSVIRDQQYFVAYEQDGAPIADTSGETTATTRIYRNYNDGTTNADNRIRNLAGVTVEDFDFTYYKTGENNFPVAGVRSVALDGDGGLWVGTYGGGIPYLPRGAETFTVYDENSEPALQNRFTSGIAVDASGGVWFSQNASNDSDGGDYGVGYMKGGSITWYRAPDTIPHDFVQAIEIDSAGDVWFGSFGGLTRFSHATGQWKTWTKADGLPAESVQSITFDGGGGLWVGFYPDTVGKMTVGTAEYETFAGGYAYINAAGEIAFSKVYDSRDATGAGLMGVLLGEFWVRSIALDKDGGAWVVRSSSFMPHVGGRVDYVSPDKQTVTSWTGRDLLGAGAFTGTQEIRMAAVDKNGGIWFGTSGAGVFHCLPESFAAGSPPNKIHKIYSSATGAWPGDTPMDNIQYMRFFGDALYVGSNGGVAWSNVALAPSTAPTVLDPPFTIRQGDKADIEWGLGGSYANNIISSTIRTDRKGYTVDGQTVEVRGALLSDILAASGVSGEGLLLTITTTDGISHESYRDLELAEIADLEYFLSCDIWLGPGTSSSDRAPVRDVDRNNVQASLRIYRNGAAPNEILYVSGLDISVENQGNPDTPPPGATQIGSGKPGSAALTIDGAVPLPGYFTLEDLQSMSGLTTRTRTYTRLNRFGTRGQDTMTGVYLEDLLKHVMRVSPDAKSVQIVSRDGYSAQYNLDTVSPLGVYSTDMSGNKMMLAWSGTSEVDPGTLRLIVGQSNPDYVNTPDWIRNISQISVNDFAVENPGGTGNWQPDTGTGTGGESVLEELTATIDVEATVVGGVATANVTAKSISDAIATLAAQAAGSDAVRNIIINAVVSADTTKTVFNLPQDAYEALVSDGKVNLTLACVQGSIHASTELLRFIGAAGGALSVSIADADTADLGEGLLSAVNIEVSKGGVSVTDFGGYLLLADIPLAPDESIPGEALAGYRIAGDKERTLVKLSAYDPVRGFMRFGLQRLSTYAIGFRPVTFSDIQGHWSRRNIEFLASHSIVEGRAAGIFEPQGTLTRAEFVKMLAESTDGIIVPEGGTAGFSDVPGSAWYAGYVRWAAELGIVQGYEDGTFRPNGNITRQEMAVMVARYIREMKRSPKVVQDAAEYSDQALIGAFAADSVRLMQQLDIMAGAGGAFKPADNATRAEAARVMRSYIDAVLR